MKRVFIFLTLIFSISIVYSQNNVSYQEIYNNIKTYIMNNNSHDLEIYLDKHKNNECLKFYYINPLCIAIDLNNLQMVEKLVDLGYPYYYDVGDKIEYIPKIIIDEQKEIFDLLVGRENAKLEIPLDSFRVAIEISDTYYFYKFIEIGLDPFEQISYRGNDGTGEQTNAIFML